MSNVPQGSVIDPVRCLLYLNDITNSINSNIRLFADDSILCRDIQMSDDYDTLQKYLQMNVYIPKCHLLRTTQNAEA